METLAADLVSAWGNAEKVKSLRFVIQGCKMLVNCQVPPPPPARSAVAGVTGYFSGSFGPA